VCFTLTIFKAIKKRQHITLIAFRCHWFSPVANVICRTTSIITAIPTIAKALFKARENQLAKPLNKPNSEPKLLSTKKYVPPAIGMAVANSALLNALGSIRNEAIRYDNITAEPAFEKAIAGKIKSPELIIAPAAIEKTSAKPSCFFRTAIFESFDYSILKCV
jgi:hypothetical protein